MGQIVGLVFPETEPEQNAAEIPAETEPEQEKPKKRRGKADAELR